jgi:hypothetical protein
MELLFPLLSAFVLGTPTFAGIGLAVAAILVFVSHEALLVVLGRRGATQARTRGTDARRVLVGLLGLAALLGLPALLFLPRAALLGVAVPWVLAVPALVAAVRGAEERSLGVELLVAGALASVAFPVAVDAGLSPARAAALVGCWTVCFAIGTFAARGVLYRAKDGGLGLVRARWIGLVTLAAAALAVVLAATRGWAPGWLGLAPMPWSIAALVLGLRPPSPKRMTLIGVSLAVASALSLAALLASPWSPS